MEQERSLLLAQQLLRDLLHHSTRPKTVKDLTARASRALRHFPPLTDQGRPLWSQDTFGD